MGLGCQARAPLCFMLRAMRFEYDDFLEPVVEISGDRFCRCTVHELSPDKTTLYLHFLEISRSRYHH